MDNSLQELAAKLKELEKSLVEDYRKEKVKQGAEKPPYIRLSREMERAYLLRLKPLVDALYASGDSKRLQIVSEFHDELRLRMMYVRHLLERDIPSLYLEHALADLGPAARVADEALEAPESAPQNEAGGGFMPKLKQSLFGGGKRREAEEPRRPAPAKVVPTTARDSGTTERLSDGLRRILTLHHLMEEDRQSLMKEGQKIPKLSHKFKMPEIFTNFFARDLGEILFGQRASNKIARTPEELRRKLAMREKENKKD